MIRKRNGSRDDRAIYRLVRDHLYPLTLKTQPDAVLRKHDVVERLRSGTTYVLVPGKGRVAGFVHFQSSRDMLLIDMLALEPSVRNRGWGHLLMDKAEERGRRRGCRYAALYVDAVNHRAQRFYLRRGYRPVDYMKRFHCYYCVKIL